MPGIPGLSQPAPATGPGGLPPGSILPYPTEEVMRRGILAFAEVSNIGETTEMTGGEPLPWLRSTLYVCLTMSMDAVRPPSPSQLLAKGKEGPSGGQQPVPSTVPVPRRAYPKPLEEEDEDIMLDLDLNPGELHVAYSCAILVKMDLMIVYA